MASYRKYTLRISYQQFGNTGAVTMFIFQIADLKPADIHTLIKEGLLVTPTVYIPPGKIEVVQIMSVSQPTPRELEMLKECNKKGEF